MALPNSCCEAKAEVMKKSPLMPARYWRVSVVLRLAIEEMASPVFHESRPTSTLAKARPALSSISSVMAYALIVRVPFL